MKKYILFIHGAGEGAYDEDILMAESLQNTLGPDYVVNCPKMINEDSPEYFEWESQISSELASLPGKVFLVGHSVGGSVYLKYVMDNKERLSIAGLFLIATPFWGADDFWKWDDVLLPEDIEARLSGIPVFFYHNRNDEVVPFSHLDLYAAKLPGATFVEVKGQGHQLENDLTEVARDIRSVAEKKS